MAIYISHRWLQQIAIISLYFNDGEIVQKGTTNPFLELFGTRRANCLYIGTNACLYEGQEYRTLAT